MVKYEKITLFDELLVLLGPIISRLFTCSNAEKTKGACSSPISMLTVALILRRIFEKRSEKSYLWHCGVRQMACPQFLAAQLKNINLKRLQWVTLRCL
jgi:hypothetical protein